MLQERVCSDRAALWFLDPLTQELVLNNSGHLDGTPAMRHRETEMRCLSKWDLVTKRSGDVAQTDTHSNSWSTFYGTHQKTGSQFH
eukprot:1608567-Amphidinium_carterae.1